MKKQKEMTMKKPRKKMNPSNKNILVATYLFFAVFIGMIGYLVYFNVVQADEVINSSYNKRQSIMAEKVVRGSILTSDGSVIAMTNVDEAGNESRYYPYNNLFAHVAGYINNGGYGLESSAAYYMLTSNENLFDQVTNDISGQKNAGDNVVTTLDMGLTQTAYDALGSNRGSVIVMEPSTGRILAMVSKPDFNPNTLAADWDAITAEGADSVLVNRATQGLYAPGSTFKLITLLEYIKENPDTYTDYSYTCDGTYELGDQTISCSHSTAHGTQDALMSLANSCNCSFINMGLTLNISKYQQTAKNMLFNSELPLSMEYNKSQFVLGTDASQWDIAQTSFGQGQTLITPIHLALIGSAIANDGTLMNPYLIDHIENVDGRNVKKFKTSEYGNLMSKDEAAIIQDGMGKVITTSFPWLYGNSAYTVAAKSGTAQYGTQGYENSLFVSYSPVENPEIVVAVVVEGGPQRNTTGAEIAKVIYDAYYASK